MMQRLQATIGPLLLVAVLLVCCLSGGAGAIASPIRSSPASAAISGLHSRVVGTPPDLGIEDGRLAPCPNSANCVASQVADAAHHIAPIAYRTDLETARQTLLRVLTVVPRTVVVEQGDRYIRFEAASRLLGFVDDGEFFFPDDEPVIHMRSASRMGASDLGVNRRRLEQIRLAMQDMGA